MQVWRGWAEWQEPTCTWGGNSKVASQCGPRTRYVGRKLLIPMQSIISTLSFSPGGILVHAAHKYTYGPPERPGSVDHDSSMWLLHCSVIQKPGSTHGIEPSDDGFAYTTTEVLWTPYPTTLSSNSLQITSGSPECKDLGEVLDERGAFQSVAPHRPDMRVL